MSVGVKVTFSAGVPALGTALGVVQTNVPGTEAVPPVRVDEVNVCPYVMALAVGQTDTVGFAAFATVTLTCPVTLV